MGVFVFVSIFAYDYLAVMLDDRVGVILPALGLGVVFALIDRARS